METTVLKYSDNAIPPLETLSTSDKFSLGLKVYLCFFIHLLNMVIFSAFAFQLFVLEIFTTSFCAAQPIFITRSPDVYIKLDPLL